MEGDRGLRLGASRDGSGRDGPGRDGPRTARVDSHQHFWDPTVADHPWMSTAPEVVRRPYGPRDLSPILAAAGIDATVLVQARHDAAETRDLLQTVAEVDWVAGVVGWVDLTGPDVAGTIARLRQEPGGGHLVGVRHHANDEPDPRWLLRPDVRRGLRAVRDAGLCFDLLIWPRESPAALELATAMPGLRFVVDHMGKPDLRNRPAESWSQTMRALGRLANVSVKLSGILTEGDVDWTIADLRPFVDVVLAHFGPERIMFGSDWPVCLAATTYEEWLVCAEQLTADLSATESAEVFGGTAARVYGLVL